MNGENSKPQNPGTGTAKAHQDILDRAIRLHRGGRLKEAETAYRELLQAHPGHPTSLHMLGVLAYQAGKYEDAISLITRAKAHAPSDAGLHTNLGNALQACGRLEEAVAAFMQAIEINPRFALAYNNLGNVLHQQEKHERAIAAFQQALSIDSNYTDTYVNLAAVYQARGEMEKAAHCYQKAVELNPDHESAAHMLAALRGEARENAPPEHVTRLFDEYAAKFDHHLVDTLGYSMPGLLRSEIDRLQGPNTRFQNVIDLGCGTGLAGIAFRPVSGHLTGIDLSPRMIDRARERNVYDILQTGDIIATLQEEQAHYELFICADVFPYIGNVRPLFSALRSRAAKGALFAFSTETHTGSSYVLRPTGRYAHAPDYLHSAAAEHGFSVRSMRTENLRKQKAQWIRGDLVVLQYQGS
ncbi:MAG: tetratricopeptide repeat protein [Thiogranum sp.]